jgi:hypothetical protein
MDNPYRPPAAELIVPLRSIILRGAKAGTTDAVALKTFTCQVDLANPILDYTYDPKSSRPVALGCFAGQLLTMVITHRLMLGALVAALIAYIAILMVRSRRIKLDLRAEKLLVDRKLSLVGLRKRKEGRDYAMVFRVNRDEIDRLANLAAGIQEVHFQRRGDTLFHGLLLLIYAGVIVLGMRSGWVRQ